jgi:hypothetical protein
MSLATPNVTLSSLHQMTDASHRALSSPLLDSKSSTAPEVDTFSKATLTSEQWCVSGTVCARTVASCALLWFLQAQPCGGRSTDLVSAGALRVAHSRAWHLVASCRPLILPRPQRRGLLLVGVRSLSMADTAPLQRVSAHCVCADHMVVCGSRSGDLSTGW